MGSLREEFILEGRACGPSTPGMPSSLIIAWSRALWRRVSWLLELEGSRDCKAPHLLLRFLWKPESRKWGRPCFSSGKSKSVFPFILRSPAGSNGMQKSTCDFAWEQTPHCPSHEGPDEVPQHVSTSPLRILQARGKERSHTAVTQLKSASGPLKQVLNILQEFTCNGFWKSKKL